MRRVSLGFARRAAAPALAAAATLAPSRTFFGKGWDNAALDTVYKHLLRKPEVNEAIVDQIVKTADQKFVTQMAEKAKKAEEHGTAVRVFLPAQFGDAHRLLKLYSLTAYPILDEQGSQLVVNIDGHDLPAFADPDDDYSKVVVPRLELTQFLAEELLKTLDWEASPRGAASFLEALYRGAEIPDHVFQTPAVIERQF